MTGVLSRGIEMDVVFTWMQVKIDLIFCSAGKRRGFSAGTRPYARRLLWKPLPPTMLTTTNDVKSMYRRPAFCSSLLSGEHAHEHRTGAGDREELVEVRCQGLGG